MLHSSPCRITTQEQTLQVLQSYQVIKSSMHLALRKYIGGERKTVIKTMQHNYQTWSIWQKTSKTSLFPFIPTAKKKILVHISATPPTHFYSVFFSLFVSDNIYIYNTYLNTSMTELSDRQLFSERNRTGKEFKRSVVSCSLKGTILRL